MKTRFCYFHVASSNLLTDHDEFQSLAQINVGHRHCVPFSLFPVGPTGLWQIQNALPQLTPGFFVVRLTQGSWWPSQFGGGFLLNSLDQSSLLAMGSITKSSSFAEPDADEGRGLVGVLSFWELLSGWLDDGTLDFEGLPVSAGGSLGVVFGLKKPFSVFCPAAEGVGTGVTVDFDLLSVAEAVSLFSDLLRVRPWLLSGIFVDGVLFPSDAVGSSGTETVEAVFGFCDGLRVNISLMFLRLSNSGINRPEVGKRYFVEYSCWRSPFLNTPGGLITSRTLTSPSSISIVSLNVA